MSQTTDPGYTSTLFINAVANFLETAPQPQDGVKNVALHGDRHFGEYAKSMMGIHAVLGSTHLDSESPPLFSKQQRDQASTITLGSKHPRRVRFLVKRLWGIDLGAHMKSEVVGQEKSSEQSAPSELALMPTKPASGSDAMRDYLNKITKENCPPETIDLSVFARHLSECITNADDKARDHLTIMLFIGAALILFRVQRSLSSDEVIEAAEAELYAALNRHLGKESESALKTALGRISRAYRCSMAAYLDIGEPSVAQYDQLWDFYKESVTAIPALVDAFFAGKFPHKHLKGIPHLPRLEDSPSEQSEPSQNSSANVVEETKAHRIVQKLLKPDNIEGLQKALEKKPPKEQKAVVESTVLAFQNLNRFFESVNKALLSQHKDAINNEIVRLQAVVQRLEV